MGLIILLINSEMVIANLAIYQIRDDFQVDIIQLQWINIAFLLSFSSTLILNGNLVDKYSPQRVLIWSIILFTLTAFLTGIAWTFGLIVVARFLQGAAASMLFVASMAVLFFCFSAEDKAKIQVFSGVASAIGIGLVPLFAGILLSFFSWRSLFLAFVPIGLALMLINRKLVFLSTLPPVVTLKQRIHLKSALALVLGFLFLLQGIMQQDAKHILSLASAIYLLASVICLTLFYFFNRNNANPIIDFTIFKSQRFFLAMLIRGLVQGLMFFYYFAIVILAQYIFKLNYLEVAVAFIIPGILLGFSYMLSYKVINRLGYHVLLLPCAVICTVCCLVLSICSPNLIVVVATNALLLFAIGTLNTCVSTYVLARPDIKDPGRINSLLFTFAYLGAALTMATASLIMSKVSLNGVVDWIHHQNLSLSLIGERIIYRLAEGGGLNQGDPHIINGLFSPDQWKLIQDQISLSLFSGYQHALFFYFIVSVIVLILCSYITMKERR